MDRAFHLDPSEAIRHELRVLLASAPKLRLVGEAAKVEAARAELSELRPDLLILEPALRDESGLAFITTAGDRFGCAVLVFTRLTARHYIQRALLAGAKGYLLKTDPPRNLLKAVRTIRSGHRWASASVWGRLASVPPEDSLDAALGDLSDREFEVFRLLGEGLSVPDIAAALGLSSTTIRDYRRRITEKLGWTSDELTGEGSRWAEVRSAPDLREGRCP